MNKNKIEIAIEMQSGQRAELQLSPRNYKQNFRDFINKYNIGLEQAINLKRFIQLSLVQISKMKFQSFAKDESKKVVSREQQKQESRELQMQHPIESPRFKKPHDDHQVEQKLPPNITYGIDKTEKKQKMDKKLSDQQGNIEEARIISVQHIKSIQKQEDVVQQSKQQQYPKSPQQRLSEQQQKSQQQSQQCQEEPIPFPEIPPSKVQLPMKDLSENLQKLNLKELQNHFLIQQPDSRNALIDSPIQLSKNLQNPSKYQQCLPKGLKTTENSLHSHKKKQNCKESYKKSKQKKLDQYFEPTKIKKQKYQSQDRSTFDRLYYQHTDSFRSKKNEEINRKQILDEIQVQKYDLNNRLKRTTKEFFYELHKRTTASWQCRNSKSKQKTQEQISKQYCTLPIKKVPISKAFKGSMWQSRSRCEAHIYQEKIEKQQSKAKQIPIKKVPISKAFKGSMWQSRSRCEARIYQEKIEKQQSKAKQRQKQIRKRIRQSKSKSVQKKQNEHQSRSCQKCSPQKKQLPQTKRKKIIPKTQQRQKKNYISQVLKEAYQQRIRQVKALI